MKIEILQEHLAAAVNQLQKIIPSKPQLPILSTILLSASEKTIELSVTDLYVGMRTTVLGKVITPGTIAIPGKVFRDYIVSLSPGKLILELDGQALTITSPTNKTVLQCISPEEFPEFPTVEGESFELSIQTLQEIENAVCFTASLDPTRPVLTTLLFRFSPKNLQIVATDGYRLATLQISQQQSTQLQQLLLPAKAISEVVRIGTQQSVETIGFTVSEKLKQVLFSIGNTQLLVRIIDGEYPPFEKIIPPEFSISVELNGKELEEQLKRALIFSRDSSNIVKFSLKEAEMTVSATSPAYGTHQGTVPLVKASDKELSIAFNARYVLEFLTTIKPEQVVFSLNEPLTPAQFELKDKPNYRYIVMPFRVNE